MKIIRGCHTKRCGSLLSRAPAPKTSVWRRLFSPCSYKADFLVVTYADIQGIKRFKLPFFAPKLAHKWAQTVGAKAE